MRRREALQEVVSALDRDREAVVHLVAAVPEADHHERRRQPSALASRVADSARKPGGELDQPPRPTR
jgi:hypothetical protein